MFKKISLGTSTKFNVVDYLWENNLPLFLNTVFSNTAELLRSLQSMKQFKLLAIRIFKCFYVLPGRHTSTTNSQQLTVEPIRAKDCLS